MSEKKKPKYEERGPAQHPDDDRMHISGDPNGISRRDDGSSSSDRANPNIERGGGEKRQSPEELDRGWGNRRGATEDV
jgi:hypothetical protein